MRIGLDISYLHKFNKTRGIGYYVQYLYDNLKKYTELEVSLIEDNNKPLQFDIIHHPSFDFFKRTLKVDNSIKNIVTVHDVIPLMYPQHYPPGLKGKLNLFFQKKQLKKADMIITDSESSKKEIIKNLKIPPEKIEVIYLAATPDFKVINDKIKLTKTKQKYNLPPNFALFTGNVNWNKNILKLTQACIDGGVDLVLVGASFDQKTNLNHPEMKSYKEFLNKYALNPLVHILGFVPQPDIVEVTNLAEVLLLPSFAEGFGLTILEAQACGVPVITSNISSMPEIAGNGAVFINPDNLEEIKSAIKKVMSDQTLKRDLIEKGFKNVQKFTWEKVAKDTFAVYEKVFR